MTLFRSKVERVLQGSYVCTDCTRGKQKTVDLINISASKLYVRRHMSMCKINFLHLPPLLHALRTVSHYFITRMNTGGERMKGRDDGVDWESNTGLQNKNRKRERSRRERGRGRDF